ncbi:MAG: hypothetical protein IJH14_04130 [Solobacterium sp.]|nr:hypothetical protein [Solobacterium sp.]
MTRINEVYAAIKKDPSLLSSLSETENTEAVPTRAMPGLSDSAVTDALREILGQNASDQEVNEVKQELEDNNLFKLYKASDGTIDAGELLEYAGELDGSGVSKDNTALRALFDGKLDLKEILLIILLLKLFKKKKQQQQTATNPLQSLFGTQPQQQTPANPLQYLFGTPQQQQTPVYGNNLFGSLFGSGQQPGSNVYTIYGNNSNSGSNSLLSLFSLSGSQPNYNNASNNLFNFVNGNNVSQSPLQSLYSLLDQAPANTVSSSGQINVGTLFSILNTLLKK